MQWLNRGAQALLIGAIVIAAAEGAVRLDDWARYGTPLDARAIRHEEMAARDTFGMHARPLTRFRQFTIDSLGFRAPLRPVRDYRERPLVVTVGASETFGLYESAGREWPAQLERGLAEACPGTSPAPIVANAAFAGMSMPTIMQDLRLRIAPLEPRVVAAYVPPAAYMGKWIPEAASRAATAPPPLPAFRLRAVPRVREALKQALPSFIIDWRRRWVVERAQDADRPFETFPEERLARYEQDLRALVGVIRSIGAEPVLVLHATRFTGPLTPADSSMLRGWQQFYAKATAAQLLEMEDRANDVLRRVASDSAVVIADPRDELAALGPAAFHDADHFTDRGAAAFAAEVTPVVASRLQCRADGDRVRSADATAGADDSPRSAP